MKIRKKMLVLICGFLISCEGTYNEKDKSDTFRIKFPDITKIENIEGNKLNNSNFKNIFEPNLIPFHNSYNISYIYHLKKTINTFINKDSVLLLNSNSFLVDTIKRDTLIFYLKTSTIINSMNFSFTQEISTNKNEANLKFSEGKLSTNKRAGYMKFYISAIDFLYYGYHERPFTTTGFSEFNFIIQNDSINNLLMNTQINMIQNILMALYKFKWIVSH